MTREYAKMFKKEVVLREIFIKSILFNIKHISKATVLTGANIKNKIKSLI